MEFDQMARPELESTRARLAADLEDLDEMTRFDLANSGDHVNAEELKAAEGRLQRLRDRIAQIDGLLADMPAT